MNIRASDLIAYASLSAAEVDDLGELGERKLMRQRVRVLALLARCIANASRVKRVQAIAFASLSRRIIRSLIRQLTTQTTIATILHSRLITLMPRSRPSG